MSLNNRDYTGINGIVFPPLPQIADIVSKVEINIYTFDIGFSTF